MELTLYIIIMCACFGYIWVLELTDVNGLLRKLPTYYPKFLIKPLTCEVCMAGWSYITVMLILCMWWQLFAVFVPMTIARILGRRFS